MSDPREQGGTGIDPSSNMRANPGSSNYGGNQNNHGENARLEGLGDNFSGRGARRGGNFARGRGG